MRKIILAFLFFIAGDYIYSQDKNESYYLRESEQYGSAGKIHYYQIMHFSDWVNFLLMLESYCFCRPLPAAASR